MLLNPSDGDSTASICPPNGSDVETAREAWVQARRLDGFPLPGHFAAILYCPRTNTLVSLAADAQGQ
ncbi:hypothetical protein [Synechococcus sp. CBW1006]|uniref:hypothetical protein n=1 Tax=Synechococcus sp. CBW1006 TaxID=1353138 RepID=UPI0018CC9E46|nr:hypothetical protein [Synechococcus sp. CBW1006]QPN65935.1 hypothetical protein H8F26_13870 [Synechococcus sp. CBW1006]